jgi:hypothetical protein
MSRTVLGCTAMYLILNFTVLLLPVFITNKEQYIVNLNIRVGNMRQVSDIHHTISNHRGFYKMGLKVF